jgi:Cof subfamily protein (haloacid dehalogenase superfamily)
MNFLLSFLVQFFFLVILNNHPQIEGFQTRRILLLSSSTRILSPSQLKLSVSNPDENDDDDDDDIMFPSSSSSSSSSFLPNGMIMNPRPFDINRGSVNTPNKLDVYGEEELASILDLHQQLYPITSNSKNPQNEDNSNIVPDDNTVFPGIHELVLQTVEELEVISIQKDPLSSIKAKTNRYDPQSPPPPPVWLSTVVQEKMKNIQAIASDVDGTIIGSDQNLHDRTKVAIQRAVAATYSPTDKLKYFFPATGKSRQGALNSLGPEIAALLSQGPGVYIQGLYCVNGDEVVFEKKLQEEAIIAVERLVAETGTSIIAYDGDTLLTTKLTQVVIEAHDIWKEPLAIEIPTIAGHSSGVHKILVCDNDLGLLAQVRPKLEELAKVHDCVVTQAVPTMIELLPSGCSKAYGVQKLCEVLGIDPGTQLLAVGDAENDIEMLKMSAIGAAVNNAQQIAKDAADVVVPLTSTEGGAGLAFEVIGGVQIISN